MIAITPRTADRSTRERVWASLEVEPQARALAAEHGLRLALHGDHTFQIIDFNFRECERVRLTMFTDRAEVKLANGDESFARNQTIYDVLVDFLNQNGFTL